MIQMPRRSVTRFFIPLIDVLLLLFCVFLLLPMVNEEELESKSQSAVDLTEIVAALEKERERLTQELAKFEELKPLLVDLEKMREELDRLRNEKKNAVQRTAFHIIDIDGKTGDIFYLDPKQTKQPKLNLTDEDTAQALIDRHQREAKGREVYYYFLYPRPRTGRPAAGQEQDYRKWFAGVANSLKENP